MKQLFIFTFLLLFITVNAQQERYSKVRIDMTGHQLTALGALGIAAENAAYKPGLFADLELSETELETLDTAGFSYEVLIEDLTAYYQQRIAATPQKINRDPADEFPVPQNWELGSMGGFYTYQQVLDKLDFMAEQWPDLITVRAPIDTDFLSHNGNPTWWVKISDNPNDTEEEPQVLYTSIIHAREGIGVQQMIYFMLHLLENYDTNDEIKTLVDNRELYFVPIANPDGYLYNEQTYPNGGGMWRKNRRNNGGSWGVDINRNFGYMWGLDDNGSSPYPTSETYRGPEAFSEPETQNLKVFSENHNFIIALNYHSYSNLLLYPWGYTDDPCADDAIFDAHATLMTRDNNYIYGPGSSTIYPTNGGSDDWMYGDTENKNAIFSYTPEVGNSGDGFWPATNRIVPLCQENMIQNMLAAWLSGSYGVIHEKGEQIVSSLETTIPFDLQRLGFGETDSWTVSLIPLDDHIVEVGEPLSFGSLDILETITDSIAISLSGDILSGDVFRFLLQLDNGEFITSDTITKLYGTTTTLFEDDCNELVNWSSSKWNINQSDYISPPASITDSPLGDYASDENNVISLIEPLELPVTTMALLRFHAKWDIEYNYDYVQLQIRENSTGSWTALEGDYTHPGSNNQAAGEPLYDGSSDWVLENIDITAFAGRTIELRFVLRSDSYVEEDGFYFDDFEIIVLDIETSLDAKPTTDKLRVALYPNPASDQLKLKFEQPSNEPVTLSFIDTQGQTLLEQSFDKVNSELAIDCNRLPAGLYLIKISRGKTIFWEKVVIQ
ncbi:MAG: M14 family zinc carboxypeptidase [Bacteroidetes bacterium]|jgi:carboxypeptidase T|nr:M14 family zinc carboxypeptidase [Bacteroidota bacterium]